MSWQYTLRSADGHVAQHVKAKDVALARRQLVHQRQVDRPRARGLRRRRAPGTPRRCTAPRPSWCATWPSATTSRSTARTSSATTTCPAPPRRPSPACTGTRARTGTGRTTSTCSARRSAATGAPARPGWSRSGPTSPRNQPAVHRLRPDAAGRALPAARLVARSSCAPSRRTTRRCCQRHRPAPATARPARCTSPTTAPRATTGQQYAVAERQRRLDRDLVPGPEGLVPQPAPTRRPRCGRPAWWRRRSRATTRSRSTAAPTRRPRRTRQGVPVQAIVAAAVHAARRAALRRRRRCPSRVLPRDHLRRRPTTTSSAASSTYYQIQFGHRIAYVLADDVTIQPSRSERR